MVSKHLEALKCQVYNNPCPMPMHENSVGLSSTTNPKPKAQPSISLPAQANLTQQKAEPLRCLALRTRGGRLKSSFVPWELSLPTC